MHFLHHSSWFCILREANLNVGSRSVHARDNNSDTTTVLFVCFLLVAQREFNFRKKKKKNEKQICLFVCVCVWLTTEIYASLPHSLRFIVFGAYCSFLPLRLVVVAVYYNKWIVLFFQLCPPFGRLRTIVLFFCPLLFGYALIFSFFFFLL